MALSHSKITDFCCMFRSFLGLVQLGFLRASFPFKSYMFVEVNINCCPEISWSTHSRSLSIVHYRLLFPEVSFLIS